MLTSGLALVFPGQGTQFAGMGADLYARFPEARSAFDEADEALGEPLSQLCFQGPDEQLERTCNAQPAVLVTSIALWRVMQQRTGVHPVVAAGHSLGEYSALVAAEALELAEGLRLVRARAQCMDAAAGRDGGTGMLAVLGLTEETTEEICAQAGEATSGHVAVANYNCPGQLVVAGHNRSLDLVEKLARERGARRLVRLAVGVASHTTLLQSAAEAFAPFVAQAVIQPPAFPVVGNAYIQALSTPDTIRSEMVSQLVRPLHWPRVVQEMVLAGAERLWELGPRPVLAGLCRRIGGAPSIRPVTTADEVETVIRELEETP
ncbi:MAG: ACP S-malonyltransferase [Anaerolineae bacterium]|nr:ACP S-malonyltransferase [Anaerolineae bacterium]